MESLSPLLPDREFFSAGEAARIVQIPEYTLRYWESRLRLPRPVRRASGHRRYTQRDLKTLLHIKDLVRNRRMTLSGARQVLLREERRGRSAAAAPGAGGPENAATVKLLRELRTDLRGLLLELSD